MNHQARAEDVRYKKIYLKRNVTHIYTRVYTCIQAHIYIYIYTNIHTSTYSMYCIYIPVYTHVQVEEQIEHHQETFTHLQVSAQMLFKQTHFWQEEDLRPFRIVTRQECEECGFFSCLVPVTLISAGLNWLGVLEQTMLKSTHNQTTIKSMSVHDANKNLTISKHSNK